jgi:uncharacterized protein
LAKLLLLLIVAFVVYLLIRGLLRSQVKGPPGTPSVKSEDMVTCARCGVNMPRSEALLEGGKMVCHNNPQCR